MIPIVLFVIGLGAVAAYELLPKTHSWVDDHVTAIKNAFAAHRAADAHLDVADVHLESSAAASAPPVLPAPSDPWDSQHTATLSPEAARVAQAALDAGIQRIKAAIDANQAAAHHTAQAGKTAQTDQERKAAVNSATKVVERQETIAAKLQQLGAGQCGVHHYTHVSAPVRDALIAKLKSHGMTVTGNNPWSIDPHKLGIKLSALWDSSTQTLYLIVTAGSGPFDILCDQIWRQIEPAIKEVIGV